MANDTYHYATGRSRRRTHEEDEAAIVKKRSAHERDRRIMVVAANATVTTVFWSFVGIEVVQDFRGKGETKIGGRGKWNIIFIWPRHLPKDLVRR